MDSDGASDSARADSAGADSAGVDSAGVDSAPVDRPAHLPALDGVRGFAALLVLWCHFPYIEGSTVTKTLSDFASFAQVGYFGVDLFFVLSGFLITRILLAEKRSGRVRIGRFFLRRSLRIFPIYYLTVAFCAVWFGLGCLELVPATFYVTNIAALTREFQGTGPLSHTWSLAVEEQFYLVWPFLIGGLALTKIRPTLAWVLPIVAIGSFLVIEFGIGRSAIAQMPVRMLSLSLGAMLAVKENELRSWRHGWILFGFCAAALTLFINQRMSKHGVLTAAQLRTIQYLGIACASTCFMAYIIGAQGRLAESLRFVFSRSWLRGVGAISYGIYLYHFVILHVLEMDYASWVNTGVTSARWFLALGLVFIIPIVSFSVIEKPILEYRKRLERPREVSAPTRVTQTA